MTQPSQRRPPLARVPPWLRRVGVSSWLTLGVIALVVVLYLGLARISGLLIPLAVAIVLAMLFHPLVDRLKAVGVPKALGSALVMLGMAVVAGGAVLLAVRGVIDQSHEIGLQLQNGWNQVQSSLTDLGISIEGLGNLWQSVGSSGGGAVSGLIQAGVSSAAAFAIGTFIGAFLLYYLMKDWHTLRNWVAGHLALPQELGEGLIEDATGAIRRYFWGITLASVPVALTIGLAMWILGLPLVATVILVTFVTSYVPYLGAIFSGAFTVLIALGSGGLTDALIMLVVVLVAQNALQTLIQTKLTSDQLSLHPIVNLGSTIVGATFAGLLGATLSAPLVAMFIAAQERIRAYYSEGLPEESEPQSPDEEASVVERMIEEAGG